MSAFDPKRTFGGQYLENFNELDPEATAYVDKSLLSILNRVQEKPVEVTCGTPLLLFLFQEVGHDRQITEQ